MQVKVSQKENETLFNFFTAKYFASYIYLITVAQIDVIKRLSFDRYHEFLLN